MHPKGSSRGCNETNGMNLKLNPSSEFPEDGIVEPGQFLLHLDAGWAISANSLQYPGASSPDVTAKEGKEVLYCYRSLNVTRSGFSERSVTRSCS
jgi:hypothetical protein